MAQHCTGETACGRCTILNTGKLRRPTVGLNRDVGCFTRYAFVTDGGFLLQKAYIHVSTANPRGFVITQL